MTTTEPHSDNGRARVCKLSSQQAYQLANWIEREGGAEVLERIKTRKSAAKAAAATLGFPLTANNLRHVYEDILQRRQPWTIRGDKPQAEGKGLAGRVARLEAKVAEIASEFGLDVAADSLFRTTDEETTP